MKKTEKKKKQTLRGKTKYPELKPNLNLKGRQDYMDTGYVNGVKDEKGNTVMRALNDEEKQFLAQFYKEWLNADPRDAKLYSEKEEWKSIFDENNARNRCLLNYAKKTNNLHTFDAKKGDRKFVKELGDYDLELMNLEVYNHENEIAADNNIEKIIKSVVRKLKK